MTAHRTAFGLVVALGIAASCLGLVSCGTTSLRGTPATGEPAGKTWCVAPNGSDKAPWFTGRTGPFRTIARALAAARPGDTVHLHAGIYDERVALPVSGTADKPIVIEGERGPNGEWLSTIDGTSPLNVQWVPAPEVGKGVYKAPTPGYEPHAMLVDGKYIPRIWPTHLTEKVHSGFTKLAYPADRIEPTYYGRTPVTWWDTIGAMFGVKDGMIYLRFQYYDDPNTRTLRAAPGGGNVEILNQSHIVLRDLQIRSGEFCVMIGGPGATGNVVERCRLANGAERVRLCAGAAHNVIRDCELVVDFYADAYLPGAWEVTQKGKDVPYPIAAREQSYHQYKRFFGPDPGPNRAMRIDAVGPGNEICGNLIRNSAGGITVYPGSTDLNIHHNTIRNCWGEGFLCWMINVDNIQFHDNIVSDCNKMVRVHQVNEPGQRVPRRLYVYNNRFYQPAGVGEGVFFHYLDKNEDSPDYVPVSVYFYQNSFAGGRSGLVPSNYAVDLGGLPNCLIVNNVFSNLQPVAVTPKHVTLEKLFGGLDHNWLGGGFLSGNPESDFTKAPWYGEHNLFEPHKGMWDASQMPEFKLTADSPARHAGLDLSKPFTVGSKRYDALPGMTPGYFTGEQPDLGAVQSK